MNENSQKLTSAIGRQRKDFHKEIDTIIEKMKSYIDKRENKHRIVLIFQIKVCIHSAEKSRG